MPVFGDVYKTGGSPLLSSQNAANIDVMGGTAYNAMRADGQRVGMFRTAGEAQRAMEMVFGRRPLRWVRDDWAGDIERYVGYGGTPDLNEIWGDFLLLQHQSDLGIQRGGVDALRRWYDTAGNGRYLLQNVAASEPIIDPEHNGFNGRQVITLDSGGPDYMDYVGWALGMVPPFTLIVVATATATLGNLITTIAGGAFSLGVDANRQWSVNNGAVITGPVASTNSADIVVVQQTAATCTLRVNQILVGNNALAPAAATPRLSSAVAAAAFDGSVALIGLTSIVDVTATKVLQSERYCSERYQVP
jgi:hypothetical protein